MTGVAFAQAEPGDDDKLACKRAYESAQELRMAGQLLEAQAQARVCMADACPAFVQSDCAQWHEELGAALPTVVFAFVDASGQDRVDVKVEMDGRALVARLDGSAVAIDPGPHRFRFVPSSGAPVDLSLTIAEGEKLRQIKVALPRPSQPTAQDDAGIHPVAWVLYGVAALGFGGFAGFGIHSLNLEDCKPRCTEDDKGDIVLMRALADASLGLGVVSLATAVGFTIAGLTGGEDETALDLRVSPSPTGASLSLRAVF
ncbi:MAG: hypothetical protein R3B72_32655 [Polyangiaceae bacterium]